MRCGGGKVGRLLSEGLGHREQTSAPAEPGHVAQQHEGDVRHVAGDIEEDRETGGFRLAQVVEPGARLLGGEVERELEHEHARHVRQQSLRVLETPFLLTWVWGLLVLLLLLLLFLLLLLCLIL